MRRLFGGRGGGVLAADAAGVASVLAVFLRFRRGGGRVVVMACGVVSPVRVGLGRQSALGSDRYPYRFVDILRVTAYRVSLHANA